MMKKKAVSLGMFAVLLVSGMFLSGCGTITTVNSLIFVQRDAERSFIRMSSGLRVTKFDDKGSFDLPTTTQSTGFFSNWWIIPPGSHDLVFNYYKASTDQYDNDLTANNYCLPDHYYYISVDDNTRSAWISIADVTDSSYFRKEIETVKKRLSK
ncbi:MAG: hypothetical protein LBD71_06330 [Treponema sp.]|jgi:hypothetical protein|nr:hypothetical protein [Treponema sp.]